MKLITHNMLTSKCLKGVSTGYPLIITATDVKKLEKFEVEVTWAMTRQKNSKIKNSPRAVSHFSIGMFILNGKVSEVDFNPEFISRVIPKLDWDVIWKAADSLGHSEGLPKTLEPNYENDEDFLKKAHKVLLEVEVEEGSLTCPESGRQFPISKGIPNMLLTEAEVQ